jgi:hypothetical protein
LNSTDVAAPGRKLENTLASFEALRVRDVTF